MAYLEKNLRRAEAMMADAFLYRAGAEHSLADLLAPRFFPKNDRMFPPRDGLPGAIGILFANDGAVWVEVAGHDGTSEQRPVLRPFVTSVVAPTAEPENLKLTRKAA